MLLDRGYLRTLQEKRDRLNSLVELWTGALPCLWQYFAIVVRISVVLTGKNLKRSQVHVEWHLLLLYLAQEETHRASTPPDNTDPNSRAGTFTSGGLIIFYFLSSGKNDGSVGGHRYFHCKPGYGVLVRPDRLTLRDRTTRRTGDFSAPAHVPVLRGETIVSRRAENRKSWSSWDTITRSWKGETDSPQSWFLSSPLFLPAMQQAHTSDCLPALLWSKLHSLHPFTANGYKYRQWGDLSGRMQVSGRWTMHSF